LFLTRFVYSLAGSILAAALTYFVGYLAGGELICRIAGTHRAGIKEAASRHGMMAAMISSKTGSAGDL
jgi:uncharacterized membrane protein YdjX (TVP38/TMEM64 family)